MSIFTYLISLKLVQINREKSIQLFSLNLVDLFSKCMIF